MIYCFGDISDVYQLDESFDKKVAFCFHLGNIRVQFVIKTDGEIIVRRIQCPGILLINGIGKIASTFKSVIYLLHG